MPDVTPGKEERYRRLQRSLAISDWVDRVIEATERGASPPGALPAPARSPVRPRGLRAGFAARLARIALVLDRQAARDAVFR